jgi:hypothetical protein
MGGQTCNGSEIVNHTIQWVPEALSLGVKRPEREADHSPSSTEVKECVELYLHSPNTTSWRGVRFKIVQGQLYLYHYWSALGTVAEMSFYCN